MIRERWWFGRTCRTFTLQWHLTNDCAARCRHCYDRSDRSAPTLAQALAVIDSLLAFCRRERVAPRLSLSGGDPLLYPHFWDLYAAVAAARIPSAILGNPLPAESIARLCAVQRPAFYQVSLEGLREHNDQIRGPGHYDRVFAFLIEARKQRLETHVMLTLTRDNLAQVIPLGGELRGLTTRFTFNRLAQVGEGASLALPEAREYPAFLHAYLTARRTNPVFGFKDNLFNILRSRAGTRLFPGCTGHGCGAAFNFLALLPDGEVHACRKFPSLLGNLHRTSLDKIYHSTIARQYRDGPFACRNCRLRKVCRGCPAVTYGHHLDPLRDRDPHCFLQNNSQHEKSSA
jgi:selenobiotic family peptide radical SAM maturase